MEPKWDHISEHFQQILEVDAPPFLLTRIQQQIKNREKDSLVPVNKLWVIAAVFLGIMLFNGWLIYESQLFVLSNNPVNSELYQVYHTQNLY